jgi:hypothetical protein
MVWKVFFRKKFNWLYMFAAWLAYLIFLYLTQRILITRYLLAYLVGTFCLGGLLFIQSRLEDRPLKIWLIFLLLVVGFIFPVGSANISLPLIFPSLLLIPLMARLLIHLNRKDILVFSILPFLMICLAVQTRSRLGSFVEHKLIARDGLYVQYSDPKLEHIYDLKGRVRDLEETAAKIREYLPQRQFFLLYPRFPIYYWLVANAVPATPKVDLETALCPEWVQFNLDHMVANRQVPRYVFEEAGSEKNPTFAALEAFIEENYRPVEGFRGYNIYELKETSPFFQQVEER